MKTIITIFIIATLVTVFIQYWSKDDAKDVTKKGKRVLGLLPDTVPINEMNMTIMTPDTDEVTDLVPLGDVTGKGILIGRSSSCDVVIPNETVSRKHCILKQDKNGLSLLDVGSSQGIYDSDDPLTKKKAISVELGKVYFIADIPIKITCRSMNLHKSTPNDFRDIDDPDQNDVNKIETKPYIIRRHK